VRRGKKRGGGWVEETGERGWQGREEIETNSQQGRDDRDGKQTHTVKETHLRNSESISSSRSSVLLHRIFQTYGLIYCICRLGFLMYVLESTVYHPKRNRKEIEKK
jgi:hypothetical protein